MTEKNNKDIIEQVLNLFDGDDSRKSRKEINREILYILGQFNEAHDDLRFEQILAALRINCEFYKESSETLETIKEYYYLMNKSEK